MKRGERGIWQRRFWEHTIRDDGDFQRHVDYIHYNPVKHRCVTCPHMWNWSSFAKWVDRRIYSRDWLCACKRPPAENTLPALDYDAGE